MPTSITPPQAHNRANSRHPVLCKHRIGKASGQGTGQTVEKRVRTSAGFSLRACADRARRQGRRPAAQTGRRVVLLAPAGRAGRAKRPSRGTTGAQRGQRVQPTRAEGGPIQNRGEPKEPQSTLESPTGLGESRAEEPGGGNGAGRVAITRKIGGPLGAPKPPRAARALAPGKAAKIKKNTTGRSGRLLHSARTGFQVLRKCCSNLRHFLGKRAPPESKGELRASLEVPPRPASKQLCVCFCPPRDHVSGLEPGKKSLGKTSCRGRASSRIREASSNSGRDVEHGRRVRLLSGRL